MNRLRGARQMVRGASAAACNALGGGGMLSTPTRCGVERVVSAQACSTAGRPQATLPATPQAFLRGLAASAEEKSSIQRKSVDPVEAEKFGSIAQEWWRSDGPLAMLHSMNPVRCTFIRRVLCQHFRLDPELPEPLYGLRVVDVGCGGGILSEALARLGATVVGVDATEKNVRVARAHAAQDPLTEARITYEATSVEEMAQRGDKFDVVFCLEVVEHVRGPEEFCTTLAQLTDVGGALVMSTMNRTPASFAIAILGAEYITRVVPQGTHNWERFVTPEELTIMVEKDGLELTQMAGMIYNPLTDKWSLGDTLSVNYIAAFAKNQQREFAKEGSNTLQSPIPS